MFGGCYVFYFYFNFALRSKIFSENQLIKNKRPYIYQKQYSCLLESQYFCVAQNQFIFTLSNELTGLILTKVICNIPSLISFVSVKPKLSF